MTEQETGWWGVWLTRADDDDDTEPRAPGCKCQWEVGDSPCPVHPSPDDEPEDHDLGGEG